MQFYVGVTDSDWFTTLKTSQATECNFWRPSGQSFKVLEPGQEFLFKLHAPFNVIAGGGTFLRSQKCRCA
jgi:putative restriction endonuclease